jgi:hypothetical protein
VFTVTAASAGQASLRPRPCAPGLPACRTRLLQRVRCWAAPILILPLQPQAAPRRGGPAVAERCEAQATPTRSQVMVAKILHATLFLAAVLPPPLAAGGATCATCVHPSHSWDTMPVSFHSARDKSNALGEFSEADMEIIARFPLVTIEKWQGSLATDASNRSVFLWEDDAMVNAARAIKKASPNTSVVVWFDTMMVYTGWNVDAANRTVNTTLNPDANAQCATGHFRPAEYLERAGRSLLLRNKTKDSAGEPQLAIMDYGHCHIFDHSQAAAREYWRDMCLNMTASGVIDGCGADFSAMGANRWADHTPAKIAADLGLDLDTAAAWAAGHRQMMKDTQAALGEGLLIGKDGAELGDHVNGVIDEGGCYKRNHTVNNLRNLTKRRQANLPASKSWVYQCHTSEVRIHYRFCSQNIPDSEFQTLRIVRLTRAWCGSCS